MYLREVRVNSRDPTYKNDNARFTRVPLKNIYVINKGIVGFSRFKNDQFDDSYFFLLLIENNQT